MLANKRSVIRPRIVHAGERYQHLTVVATRMPGEPKVHCRCDCGREVFLWLTALRRQHSCGCMTAIRIRQHRLAGIENRFWSRVERSQGCWEWIGARSSAGYGVTSKVGRWMLAHRLSWEIANGPIPAELYVLHHCDNPPCVRPDHLYVGTAGDNLRDTHSRHPTYSASVAAIDKRTTGELSPNAKLTERAVQDIRAIRGMKQRDIGRLFGVSQTTIWRVLRGYTWRHVMPAQEIS